ncbi:MAG: hypothetical protein QM652_11370 [Legionella sp.]|uniref:hypothetical protein n=1 Tax=Legionella sp. TaxID=459 RepID=UPI0039E290D0
MSGLSILKLLAEYAPYQLHRFAMDLNKQGTYTAVRSWESTEPGSLQGVLNAYAYVIPIIIEKKHINFEDIINIHIACASNVSMLNTVPGKLRNGYSVAFGIVPETCSEDGLKELVEEHKKYPYQIPSLSDIKGSGDQVMHLNQLLRGVHQGFYINSYDGKLTADEIEEFSELHSKQIETTRYMELKEKFRKNLINEIKRILENLYTELESTNSDQEKLTVIVKWIQRLERLHPFQDCNCRVFCMVLLNTLLMQCGFPPTLIDNPNKFDGYSIKELVSAVQMGFDQTNFLIKYVLKEKSNPTFFTPFQRPPKESSSGPCIDDLMDDEDYLPLNNHWCDIHPIQRDELTNFANKLVLVLNSDIKNNEENRLDVKQIEIYQ